MKRINAFFHLIRFQNLLIIALLMYFVRIFLLKPVYDFENLELQMDGFSFFLFVLGYLLLAAGGYAINDYYDIGIDEINRPEKTILRKELPLSVGQTTYFILTTIGVAISLWAIFRIQAPKLVFILAIVTLLYWFYSTKYKRELISGNLAVAFLAALCVGIVWLYEFFASIQNGVLPLQHLRFLTIIIFAYAGFAFLLTLVREIVKDIADIEGDKEFHCSTIPIVYGIKSTKIIIWVLVLLTIAGTIFAGIYFFQRKYNFMMIFSIIVFMLLVFFLMKLIKASNKKDFIFLSDMLKIIFLAGIVSMQVFSLEIQ